MKRVFLVTVISLVGLLTSCTAGKTRMVPAKPTPCLVPERPQPPEIRVGVCVAEGEEFVCIPGPDAAALGAYLEALHKWVQIASECPGIGELGAGNAA